MDWLQKPLRIADFTILTAQEIRAGRFDVKKNIEKKVDLGFNCEHFYPYKAEPMELGQARGEPDWELLSVYLEEAHRKGIRVFVYYNVHAYRLQMAEAHPDWFQRNIEGKIIDAIYGKGVMSCVNTAWREYSYSYIRKFAEHGVDGIFLDGPAFYRNGCYCQDCQTKFKNRYGKNLPPKGELSNPDHRLLVEFQEDSVVEYIKGAFEICQSMNPKVKIYLNGEPLRPNWSSGRNNRKLELYQDLVGAEGGFIYGKLIETPIFKPGMTAKGLEAQVSEKPRVIFVANKHGGWSRNSLTAAELKILCAQTLANGSYCWIGQLALDRISEEASREINNWVAKNEEYFAGTRNASKIGLFWSQNTSNSYGGEIPQSDFTGQTITMQRDYMKSFQGAYEILQRGHIPFRIVDNLNVAEDLQLIVLANCACLDGEEIEALQNFVKKGGNLIVSFETSLYSFENRTDDFLLSQLLGVRYRGIEEYGAYENYFEFDHEFFPAFTYVLKVEPTAAQALAYVSENTKGFYQPINMSPFPAVCANRYGKGKIYYFAGNFFQTYFDYKFTKYLSLFGRIFDSLTKREIIVENAPSSIDLSLREKDNLLLVHLVNYSSDLKRPMETIVPVAGVVVKLPDIETTRVRALIGGTVSWKSEGGFLKIEIPWVQEYEVIAIERKS